VTLRLTMGWLWQDGQAEHCPPVEALAGEVFETRVASAWRVGWGEEGGHSVRRGKLGWLVAGCVNVNSPS
jgi:hypothetical protein